MYMLNIQNEQKSTNTTLMEKRCNVPKMLMGKDIRRF